MAKIAFPKQKQFCDQILNDLNVCAASVNNERFGAVVIELVDEADPLFQAATELTAQPQTDPNHLSIWRPGNLRLFISHRDNRKADAKQLANALETYGISAFVAHDTIEPMTTWQREIEKGLQTMEIMLAFITDDFHGSTWTNQEIGYALGKGIPIIPVKLEGHDPAGFIGPLQALKGRLDEPDELVKKIYEILCEKLGQKDRLQQAVISAFIQSPDFNETKVRFDRMENAVKTLSDDELARINKGLREITNYITVYILKINMNAYVNLWFGALESKSRLEPRTLR